MENEENEIFQKNWASFIQSLDVGPEKAKGIEQLPADQKRHLLESYVCLFSKFTRITPPIGHQESQVFGISLRFAYQRTTCRSIDAF
ncbi:formin-like protein [Clonorchis sinensis]|uniref:Formin-like protein n=1 Tax=Clonorchis sinensis TaxID=79923 RepID=G7Y9F7_CLOSI|nr:formin-like protein [Clonorchis sinensis]